MATNLEVAASGVTVKIPYAETAADLIKMFGDGAVFSNATAKFKAAVRTSIKAAVKAGIKPADIQARFANVKMAASLRRPKMTARQKLVSAFSTATPEEQQAILMELREKVKK